MKKFLLAVFPVFVMMFVLLANRPVEAHGLGGHFTLHKGNPCVQVTAHGIGDKISFLFNGWVEGPCPSVSPSPSPSVEPSEEPSPSPSPSEEPSASPSVAPVSVSGGQGMSEAVAPRCWDFPLVHPMAHFLVKRMGSVAVVQWIPTNGDKAHIYYKESSSSEWQHSLRDISNNGYAVIGLLDNPDYTFAGQQVAGCGVSPLTQEVKTTALNETEQVFK